MQKIDALIQAVLNLTIENNAAHQQMNNKIEELHQQTNDKLDTTMTFLKEKFS